MIKSKDLYLVIILVIISAVISLVLANIIFKTEKVKTKVEVVESINSDFPLPDQAYFNKTSINPTQTISIGDGSPDPFKNSGQ